MNFAEHIAQLPQGILVFGANGQVGSVLTALLNGKAIAFTQQQADFTQPDSILALLEKHAPLAVINAAAYTAVDKAESEEALALQINATTPALIARYCAENRIPLVHYSTDYVYDGQGEESRAEDAPTGPLGAYGRTKLKGDEAISASGAAHYIFRTSWVYDAYNRNFLTTMLRLGAEKESLSVVADQVGSPTYAPHLAEATLAALSQVLRRKNVPSGVYHLCNSGKTSWHGFAEAIFERAKAAGIPLKVTRVVPIATEQYPTPAKRPRNSRLSMQKLEDSFGIIMPSWEEGLDAAIALIAASTAAPSQAASRLTASV